MNEQGQHEADVQKSDEMRRADVANGEAAEHDATAHEEFRRAGADRAPTPEEEAAAERARRDVDLDSVGAEYQHMTEVGAEVRGEGEIEPSS